MAGLYGTMHLVRIVPRMDRSEKSLARSGKCLRLSRARRGPRALRDAGSGPLERSALPIFTPPERPRGQNDPGLTLSAPGENWTTCAG